MAGGVTRLGWSTWTLVLVVVVVVLVAGLLYVAE
jgi:hypothetical protein